MNKNFIYAITLWLITCPVSYAVETYFPGDGPPSAVDVETRPRQYYPPQNTQPDPDEEAYTHPDNPPDAYNLDQTEPDEHQPIESDVTSPTNKGSWGR